MAATLDTALVEKAKQEIFASGLPVYAILDGALIDGLQKRLENEAAHYVCLYRGEIEPWLKRVAPYLVCLERDAALTNWILGEGFGKHWGIFLTSNASMRELRKHFRQFLLAKIPNESDPVYFRYYDARVLSLFLPTCDEKELTFVFGPILEYFCENENSELSKLRAFTVTGGELISRNINF